MIIWGWKQYPVLLIALVMSCDQCGNHAEQAVYKVTTKFTLFFIPLFPVGVKHLIKCAACGQEQKVPKDRADQLAAGGAPAAPPMGTGPQPMPHMGPGPQPMAPMGPGPMGTGPQPAPPMGTGPQPAMAPGMGQRPPAPRYGPGPQPPYAPPPGSGYGPPQGMPPGPPPGYPAQNQPPWGPQR